MLSAAALTRNLITLATTSSLMLLLLLCWLDSKEWSWSKRAFLGDVKMENEVWEKELLYSTANVAGNRISSWFSRALKWAEKWYLQWWWNNYEKCWRGFSGASAWKREEEQKSFLFFFTLQKSLLRVEKLHFFASISVGNLFSRLWLCLAAEKEWI